LWFTGILSLHDVVSTNTCLLCYFNLCNSRTVNVEYNQLDPLLRASGVADGDVNDPKTGFSPFPGNINQLLFDLDAYVTVLERTKGLMPEFVNPKYADKEKTVFKNPTRLECMMQDFPTVLESEETLKVGFTGVSASLCFSPVKNATSDGVKLQEQGSPPATAATGEADQVRSCGNNTGASINLTLTGTLLIVTLLHRSTERIEGF
jgi:hypothetical protein